MFHSATLQGGKVDDITVVTALVAEEPVPLPAAEAVSIEQP